MKRLAQFVGALGSLLDLGATAMPRRAHRRRRQRSPAEQVRAAWDDVAREMRLVHHNHPTNRDPYGNQRHRKEP